MPCAGRAGSGPPGATCATGSPTSTTPSTRWPARAGAAATSPALAARRDARADRCASASARAPGWPRPAAGGPRAWRRVRWRPGSRAPSRATAPSAWAARRRTSACSPAGARRAATSSRPCRRRRCARRSPPRPHASAGARPAGATILLYHRVADAPDDGLGLRVSTAAFAEQVALLARTRRVVPLADIAAHAGDPRALAITFDDGYADNLAAADVLEAAGLPWTLFVSTVTSRSAGPFFWDEVGAGVRRRRARAAAPGAARRPARVAGDDARSARDAARRAPGP